MPGVTFVDPVLIQDGARIERSTIGPNVTVEAGARISDSTVRNSIVGRKALIDRATLADSMIGDRVVVENFRGSLTLGDDSEIRGGQA
jgi:glucose-1-phosphate thymidylyltransferase